MRLHVTKLHAGDMLRQHVFAPTGLHIMAPGTVITDVHIALLLRHQIEYVEIMDARANDASSGHVPEPPFQAQYDKAVDRMKSMFDQAYHVGFVTPEEIDKSYDPLIESMQQETDIVGLLLTLNSKDDYTYEHCIQVGMLSYYIAKWLGHAEEEAYEIGKAGFLHDIGKSKIHRTILLKPSRLTDEEYAQIKKHTEYGYEIIMKSLNDRMAAYAALQHHERANGEGYPFGITYDWVQPASKIVAVADVYSAMISSRVYQQKQDLFVVLKELYALSFSELDPKIAQTFIRRMIPNFIGKEALLSNGRIGEIVMNHTTELFQPLVRIGSEFLDLSRVDVEIEKIVS
ncbi:HD-GYP domain-containing protein [Paenibacillus sp.]|uniref:HD-GYP domain-containing protein n=1 Tax=Paenibacillus sp. TaxID=58172 RepID=UPI0028127A64|nr:HD-GYP domain-containing protein [Paenibacillus sp.]